MSEITELKLFPDDAFHPSKFGVPQRLFLLKHLGKTPRGAGFTRHPRTNEWVHEELPRPVWVKECFVALTRIHEEFKREDRKEGDNATWLNQIRKALMATLEIQKEKERQQRQFGEIDYAAIGIGHSEGMKSYEDFMVVPMTAKHTPQMENWAQKIIDKYAEGFDESKVDEMLESELAAETERVTETYSGAIDEALAAGPGASFDPEKLDESDEEQQVVLTCPFCDTYTTEGKNLKRPQIGLDNHIRMKHKEKAEEYEMIQSMARNAEAVEPTPPGPAVEEVIG